VTVKICDDDAIETRIDQLTWQERLAFVQAREVSEAERFVYCAGSDVNLFFESYDAVTSPLAELLVEIEATAAA
jgi:hypothetical protein